MRTRDIVKCSAHCINCVYYTNEEIARKVRTRARQLFEVLAYQGLPYLFAYAGGKAGERALVALSKIICSESEPEKCGQELARAIRENKLSPEDASYGLYGASIICILSKVTGTDLTSCSLEELIYKYGFDRLMQRLSYEVARWLKFFAEAKLPSE